MIRIFTHIADVATGKAPLGELRSKEWGKVRKNFLKYHPVCIVCGAKKALNVHHIIPFHVDRSKELEPMNLATLCRKHHLIFGHLECFKSWNEKVVIDSTAWWMRLKGRP